MLTKDGGRLFHEGKRWPDRVADDVSLLPFQFGPRGAGGVLAVRVGDDALGERERDLLALLRGAPVGSVLREGVARDRVPDSADAAAGEHGLLADASDVDRRETFAGTVLRLQQQHLLAHLRHGAEDVVAVAQRIEVGLDPLRALRFKHLLHHLCRHLTILPALFLHNSSG